MTRHILSKSTFMYGAQCLKRLYFHKFKGSLRNSVDEEQQSIFTMGTNIGLLAQDLFPGGVNAEPPDPFSYHISVEKTRKLIESGQKVIYEAAFNFEGVLCAVDILVNKGGGWYAFEVKGSTKVKDPFIMDASLQHYVISNCGVPLEDFFIVHLNNQYVRKGELEIQQLFSNESVKDRAVENKEFIETKIIELKTLLKEKKEPVVEIGRHCSQPYECDFTAHCWAGFQPEVVPSEENFDADAVRDFLNEWEFPLYFFDFETIMPAVPEFDNSRPYQQIPFQYSLHKQTEDGNIEHVEFLGDGVTDPREALTRSLLKELGDRGSIVTWNRPFEMTRLRELARDFPQFADEIAQVLERVVDLMTPFRKRWYYIPAFNESASLKSVLPALVPSLSYKDLAIQEGGVASLIYTQLKQHAPDVRETHRTHLLEYCKLDTLAMVEIFKILDNYVQVESQ
jgi:hypothetical protein